jgi:uncharacterized membrane protein (UPF0127 family)
MQTRAGAVALAMVALACARGGPVAAIHTGGGTVEVQLEVARTPAELERGLMYRSALADGHGMLFVFADDANHQFWMKNTVIPLDMLFIARDGPGTVGSGGGGRIVGIHRDATPLSTAQIGVGAPSRYVLEVPGGYARRRGIAVGDSVELVGVPAP